MRLRCMRLCLFVQLFYNFKFCQNYEMKLINLTAIHSRKDAFPANMGNCGSGKGGGEQYRSQRFEVAEIIALLFGLGIGV